MAQYFFMKFKHFLFDCITVIMYSSHMNEKDYFLNPSSIAQKKYEALRAFFVAELSAKEVAAKFGYTYRAFTSLVADFRKARRENKLF